MYVVFEGPEAVGKSTQIARFGSSTWSGKRVLLTREPGTNGSNVCKSLRSVIMDPDIVEESALFCFLADRAQHVRTVVLPAISSGSAVISDRSSLSSIIYHVANKFLDGKIDYEYLGSILPAFDLAQSIAPDAVVLLSADYEWANKNILSRKSTDRIEQKGERFLRTVHGLFENLSVSSEFSDFLKLNLATFPKSVIVAPRSDFSSEQVVFDSVKNQLETLGGKFE